MRFFKRIFNFLSDGHFYDLSELKFYIKNLVKIGAGEKNCKLKMVELTNILLIISILSLKMRTCKVSKNSIRKLKIA